MSSNSTLFGATHRPTFITYLCYRARNALHSAIIKTASSVPYKVFIGAFISLGLATCLLNLLLFKYILCWEVCG